MGDTPHNPTKGLLCAAHEASQGCRAQPTKFWACHAQPNPLLGCARCSFSVPVASFFFVSLNLQYPNTLQQYLNDEELKTLARAAVRPLEKRGRPYLFNEGKMIKARLFPQVSACRKRLCDAQARRMKGIVEASRKAALRQRDAGIAPPEDDSDGSAPENPPEGDDEEGVLDYVPEETRGPHIQWGLWATRRALEQVGPLLGRTIKRGAEAAGEHSGVMAPEILTHAEPIPTPAPEISTLTEPISTPPGDSGVEMRHPNLDSENPTVDLNSHGRQSGKRKTLFSPSRPTPKIPRVVAYVDSSSGDEGGGEVGKNASMTPPRDQIKDSVGGSAGSPRVASSAELPKTYVGGLDPSTQTDDPAPETMLQAEPILERIIGVTSGLELYPTGSATSSTVLPTLGASSLDSQVLTVKSLLKEARLELEIQGVDRFKRSPAYDALLLQEFQRGMVSAGEFFKQKNRAIDRARANWSLSIKKHVDTSLESLRIQMKEWWAYCRSKGKAPHPMHLEVPITDSFSTFYACEKAGIDNEKPDLGPIPGTDYNAWIDEEEDVIVWLSDDSLLSEYVMEPDPSVGGSSSQPPTPPS
ncbi:hypothetical protein LWI29_023996 [Acer saccharum]|uniref:Uncharacterized protein n=1 Tax=Acer saccharum TaxID=4024 RepID=A0AA39SD82_ACESA|nr:hypothetical protein LWI29_023996 [Acer saccharum]